MRTSSSYLPVALAALLLVMGHSLARGDTFSAYQLRPALQFAFPDVSGPGVTQGPTVFDVLGDGRIMAVVTGASGSNGTPKLYVQQAVHSTTFSFVGDLPTSGFFPSFGASFMSISRDGTKAAINDNDVFVGVFSTASPVSTMNWLETDGFQFAGTWVNNTLMAVSGSSTIGSGGTVGFLDTTKHLGDAGFITPIITGISSSADVLFDYDAGGNPNNMYTGDGFGANVGQIRKFSKAAWQGAQSSGIPLDFSSGTLVTTFSTAGNLDFDTAGNLVIGGSPVVGGIEGLAVFRPSDSTRRTFDPASTSGNTYYTVYNKVTGEIYVNEPFPAQGGSNRTVYVIAPVPEPGTFVLAFVGFGLLCSHLALSRRGS